MNLKGAAVMIRGMRKVSSLVLCVALALPSTAAIAGGDNSPGTSGARISVENKRHDFGNVYERESFVHTFDVKNIGTEDLIIEDVHPACGCTVAEFDSIIAPGQTGKITLDLDGSRVSGDFNKSAAITSNDPEHPKISVSMGGHILQYIDVEPARVYLRSAHGKGVEREITIKANEQEAAFKILGVSSTIDDKITYRVDQSSQPGVYKIKIFKNPMLGQTNKWGSLNIETNNEHTPTKTVKVNVITPGTIVVSPPIVDFGRVGAEQINSTDRIEKVITVYKEDGRFNIRDVSFSSDRYVAKVEPIEKGRMYRVVVGFHPDSDKVSYSDEMFINTDDPLEPAVRVRLIARGV
jgi:hypothetical protein